MAQTKREKILKLKEERRALILSHYYEDGDIQDIADFVGDSLALAEQGEKSSAPVLVLAGVRFMAESAKILSPEKTVLLPDLNAGCSLVDQSPYEAYLKWRMDHPDAICVSYVNSSAEVKSITDVCCTSSNAERIIQSIPQDRRILFGPDRNLGRYLSQKLGRDMILWPGACEVHILFSERKLHEMKQQHPGALVLAHPECDETVLRHADVIGATSRLLHEVATNKNHTRFIVATEVGIFHQMQKARPEATLIQAPTNSGCACNECPYMKLNTLDKIAMCLTDMRPQIQLTPSLIEKARASLTRMLAISRGEPVHWPERFLPASY